MKKHYLEKFLNDCKDYFPQESLIKFINQGDANKEKSLNRINQINNELKLLSVIVMNVDSAYSKAISNESLKQYKKHPTARLIHQFLPIISERITDKFLPEENKYHKYKSTYRINFETLLEHLEDFIIKDGNYNNVCKLFEPEMNQVSGMVNITKEERIEIFNKVPNLYVDGLKYFLENHSVSSESSRIKEFIDFISDLFQKEGVRA